MPALGLPAGGGLGPGAVFDATTILQPFSISYANGDAADSLNVEASLDGGTSWAVVIRGMGGTSAIVNVPVFQMNRIRLNRISNGPNSANAVASILGAG